jgi:hypothetical protein
LLQVGGSKVELPLERSARMARFDPGPAVLALGAAWAIPTMAKRYGGAPPAIALPWAAAYLGLAVACHRRTAAHDEPARGPVVAAALAVTLGHTASVTRRLRCPVGPDGQVHFPFMDNAVALSVLLGLYWRELPPRWKTGCVAGTVALGLAGLVLARRPLPWARLGAEALWLVSAWASAGLVPSAYRDEAEEHNAALADQDRTAIEGAFAEGRSSVLGLVSGARFEAWRSLNHADIGPHDREAVVSRLEVIDKMLEELQ